MKRLFSLLLALSLALSLAACGEKTAAPSPAPEEPAVDEPAALELDELNIEFVVGERKASELMALQKELPPLLIAALAQQGCTVEKINITFGASADATARSLQSGSIDVAFLPSEVYAACGDVLRVVCAEIPSSEATYETVFLLLTHSEAADVIREQDYAANYLSAHAGELVWLLPEQDEAAARCANQWLTYTCDLSLDDVTVKYYADAAALTQDAGDILVRRGTSADITMDDWVIDSCALEGECVAVNAADKVAGSDEFAFVLKSALFFLSHDNPEGSAVLAHYATVGDWICYTPTFNAAYDAMRYALGYLDEMP